MSSLVLTINIFYVWVRYFFFHFFFCYFLFKLQRKYFCFRKRVGEVFIEHKERFLKYGEYCAQLPKSHQLLETLCSKWVPKNASFYLLRSTERIKITWFYFNFSQIFPLSSFLMNRQLIVLQSLLYLLERDFSRVSFEFVECLLFISFNCC